MSRTLLAVAFMSLSAPALAQEGRFELRSTNEINRSDPFAEDDVIDEFGVAGFGLETGFDSNNWVRRVQPAGGGAVWRFEGQARVRSYFDRDDLNSTLLTPRIQYWKRFADNRFQFRARAAYSTLSRDGDQRWTRPEGEVQLRYRAGGKRNQETVARLRVTEYDFEEDFVSGLDQTRVRAGLEQFFRTDENRTQLRLSLFYEEGDADAARNSFTEVRTRAGLDHDIFPDLTLSLEADYRDREFEGEFSPMFPVVRADERFIAEARVEKRFSQRLSGYLGAGHLQNSSNIAPRDYGGAIFRAGFRLDL